MHELSIAKNIIRIAGEHLSPDEEALLTKVRVRLGKFSTIVPDLLQSGFEAAVDGTAMENAKLEITVIPLRIQCNSCGEVREIEPLDFTCPDCSSNDVDIIEGNEIMIENLEITEPINH